MNMSTSKCSSGCESGWTTYLDHSSISAYQYEEDKSRGVNADYTYQHEEDKSRGVNADYTYQHQVEDLSMVSDASSGPRYFYEPDNSSPYFSASEQGKKKQKNKMKEEKQGRKKKMEDTFLDDTASSPVLSLYNDNQASMEPQTNQDYSASQYKGKSGLKKHFGFLKSSVSGKSASQKSGGLQGRKRQ